MTSFTKHHLDGILNAEFAKVLANGTGSVHGIDSSPAMIDAARELCKDSKNATFEVLDAGKIHTNPDLQKGSYNKAFSNAAMHWILRSEDARKVFFHDVYASLAPGGTFAFEMGGLGNVSEMSTALLMVTARRVGMPAAQAAFPWFFPDEEWATAELENAGFKVEKVEREWRPTKADKGGVEGWLRLFGGMILEVIPENERDEAVKEAVEALKLVCKQPDGGEMVSYVRLRALATKV
ncbi:hypothetical protein VHEMI04853 [[Torrubiella] hemipterigena]|uniref:Methyltransferase domain-containing protein n=1 Tax=[Torrubiella] hemipterigena TaxID=1531966 RepID=A0A0A1TF25_9HYPO|nr:hypothetical protein VHEMI04853 [[Torrubiella] hemipterigena]